VPDLLVGRLMPEHAHLAALAAALDREARAQHDEHRAAVGQPLEGRIACGVAWAPLTLEAIEPAGRRLRLVLRGTALHEGIGPGDPVMVGPIGDVDDGIPGLCVGTDHGAAEVLVDDPVSEADLLMVTKRFDRTTFDRYRAALDRADTHRSALRDVLLGLRDAGHPIAHGLDMAAFSTLDDPQTAAARVALSSAELALIHGPPGTGKTTVLTALLVAFVAKGDRPWALADSNAAVDHLALSAARAGLTVVRLGHPARMGSEAARLSIDERIRTGPLGAALQALDREFARARASGSYEVRALAMERSALMRQARDHAIGGAQVIASTLGTLARQAPDLPRPHTAVVDEATQALEPAVWVPVPFVERLVIVGDPHQLGPVVVDAGNPLERSMLVRLVDDAPVPFPRLDIQYRMNTPIQSLVEPVYGATYRPGPQVGARRLTDLPGVQCGGSIRRAPGGTRSAIRSPCPCAIPRRPLASPRSLVLCWRRVSRQETSA
jgi:DNA polymerase III delta prime subunit